MVLKNKTLKINQELKITQINPKLRSCLLVFSSWFFSVFLFWFLPCFFLVPYFQAHIYLPLTLIGCFLLFCLFYRFYLMRVGIKYQIGKASDLYQAKNHQQIAKIKNLKLTDLGCFFNVFPYCPELKTKKQRSQKAKRRQKLVEVSWIEACMNRLVVNGKINDCDFSWGICTRMEKTNRRVFWLSILYFGPLFGPFWGWFARRMLNASFYEPGQGLDPLFLVSIGAVALSGFVGAELTLPDPVRNFKYKRLGCWDLFPNQVGKLNSENYLLFAAKMQNQNEPLTLVPNDETQQYEWPPNISGVQKNKLQKLVQKMQFLPRIYIVNDQISIVMKKYYYNEQDNQQLQTWELLKDSTADSAIQFNYLTQAVKIYQIFNEAKE